MSWKGAFLEKLVWIAGRFSTPIGASVAESPGSILVLRSSDLGDLLTTTPLFESLRTRFPHARIIAGVGSWGKPIVENNPFIDEIVELDAPWNNKFSGDQSWRAVLNFILRSPQVLSFRQRRGVDVGIDVVGSHLGSLLMMRLGVRYRVGVRGYRGGWSVCQRYIQFEPRMHVGRAALAQAELLGATHLPEVRPQIYLTSRERSDASRIWDNSPGHPSIRLLVACGSGFESKCWPAHCFAEVLLALSQEQHAPARALNILLVGSSADRERAFRILSAKIPHVRSLCGDTSLRTTFALAEQADLVLTNASMMLHVAAAFLRPTVTVVGGAYPDAADHDIGWGYPPPYSSIGPTKGETWPSVDRVVAAVEHSLGFSVRTVPIQASPI